MKILVLGSYDKSLVVFRGELIKTLVDNGHEVIACAAEIGPDVRAKIEKYGAIAVSTSLERTSTSPAADLKYLQSLKRLFREHRPDKVIAYTMKPVIYGSLAARWTGVGESYSLITGLGYAFTGTGFKRALVSFIVKRLLKTALTRNDAVLFQNPDDRDLFLQLGLVSDQTRALVVNGSGVDTEFFAHRPVSGEPVFLMIARLLADKGVREYAAAAALVKRDYPHARFELAGWLDDNPQCISQQELDDWVDSGAIDFVGRLDDVRPAFGRCLVYVLPSYREGTPRTNLEAMSTGRAVITTDAPGCRETVEDGRNGLLVPVGDKHALAAAMRRFLSGECSAAAMGDESRKIAEKKYNVHTVNRQILECMGLC